MKLIRVYQLGKRSFGDTLNIQRAVFDGMRKQRLNLLENPEHKVHSRKFPLENSLFLVEHIPQVYTLGRRDSTSDLLYGQNPDKFEGIEVTKTSRGGAVTWHGPGQLVGYPILNLTEFHPNLRWYIDALQKTIILSIAHYGIEGHATNNVGVWIQDQRKIAAIGIAVSNWITMHGFALNVCNDLKPFSAIVPCGLVDKEVSSISKEVGRTISVEELVPIVVQSFGKVFNAKMELCEFDESLIHLLFSNSLSLN